jgi:hypothetical protein
VTVAAGAALRARLGTWRLVHVRPLAAGGDAAGEGGDGAEEGEEERQAREMAPLLGGE